MYEYLSYSSNYKSYDDYSSYGGYDYDYPSNYASHSSSNEIGTLSSLLGFSLVTWLIIIIIAILTIIGMWKAFQKGGHDGWESLIGGHNTFVRFQLAGIKTYWFFLLLIPFVNIVIIFWLNIEFAKAYGKGAGFGIGLTLLPFIFFPILGFGDAQYMGISNNSNYNSQQYNNPGFYNNQQYNNNQQQYNPNINNNQQQYNNNQSINNSQQQYNNNQNINNSQEPYSNNQQQYNNKPINNFDSNQAQNNEPINNFDQNQHNNNDNNNQ